MALVVPRIGEKATDIVKSSQDSGDQIAFCLRTKGFCCIGDGVDASLIEQARKEADLLKESGRMQTPAELVQEGLLGSDGSAKTLELELFDFDDANAVSNDGEALGKIDREMMSLINAFAPYQNTVGFECSSRSPAILHQSGQDCSEGDVELSDMEADKYLSIFMRQKVEVIVFLGPSAGMLELQPQDDEANPTDIMTYPGLIVLLRTDQLSFKYSSPEPTMAMSCSFLQDNILQMHSIVREAHMSTTAQAIQDHVQERLKEMKTSEGDDTVWGADVPRNFVLAMNHNFFKIRMTAVRGCGVRFPTTWDPDTWFCASASGCDYVTDVPLERWDHSTVYDASETCWQMTPPKTNCKHASFIDGIELFDCKMFGLSPAEVKSMDPGQRLCLETGYEALHRGGVRKNKMLNSSCGMYVGCSISEWGVVEKAADHGTFGATGTSAAITAGRVSFCLGLKGACLSIDTEAAASLTSTLYAVESVQQKGMGRVQEFAVSMGVHCNLAKAYWPALSAAGFLCPGGRCFTFDETAAGQVKGEGCGSLMVKLLNEQVDGEQVVEDDENIVGILGAGSSNHSGKSASLTAPNGTSIQELLTDCCRHMRIQPYDVDACDIHGAAQFLGDAVDVHSTNKALRDGTNTETLIITAAKSQMGNGIESAGMHQILKALLATKYGVSVPNIHLGVLNPHIELEETAVNIPTEQLEYRMTSCFQAMYARGFGGMNVSLMSYGSVDEEIRAPPKAIQEGKISKLSYWPAGGGYIEDHPRQGYFICGSWNEFGEPQKMEEESNDVYGFTVTLGACRWEKFAIVQDGDLTKVLHPNRHKAPKGTMLFGPSGDVDVKQNTWLIDGRTQYTAYESLTNGENAAHEFEEHSSSDQGRPGTQYRVRLHVSGKWRTVTWTKIGFVELDSSALGKYQLLGNWNNWSLAGAIEMDVKSSGVFEGSITLSRPDTQFVVLRNRDMGQVIYPLAENADMDSKLVGPDERLYETQWCIQGARGDTFRVELQIGGAEPSLRWEKLA